MSPELTRNFNALNKGDASLAGGKGASLGEMTQAGIPVPPGFVVLSNSFERFIEETDLVQEIDAILGRVNHKEIHTVDRASEDIRGLILSREMPEDIKKDIESQFAKLGTTFVAVRSSATAEDGMDHAWAGQLESYLNTTKVDLLEKVKRCWSSLFTPRAIFYRFEKGLHATKISVAVVVQNMVESEVSGIAFSVHPVTEDYNQLIIEAGFGLGEAIVSGQITPDSYVVEKEPRNILDVNVSTQERALYRSEKSSAEHGNNEWRDIPEPRASSQVLTTEQILELSEIILKIENHYGFPCDIEWAFEAGKFYIVQSRPITTLSKKNSYPEIVLSKYMSREHSLFYAHVWNEANRDFFNEHVPETNIRNMLFSFNKLGVLEVYYDLKEIEMVFDRIASAIKKDPKILDAVTAQFYQYWEKLLPYVQKKKRIQTVGELKEYYTNWMRWWSPMAYVFVIPDRSEVPEELRKKALKVREQTQEYSDEGDRIFTDFIDGNYPQYQSVAHLFTPDEVYRIDSLSEKEIKQIKDRKNGCVLATLGGKSKLISASELSGELKNAHAVLEKSSVESTPELKGMPASPGVVTGKVKLVLTKLNLDEIQDGDVMVTYATSPDYVPAMKKCSAIVTDEGGVVCHAAIVSRELRIPCIVGTKSATQALKDGDMVEVDAEKGIVKIIS